MKKLIALASGIFCLIGAGGCQTTGTGSGGGGEAAYNLPVTTSVLRHVVLFKFKPDVTPEQIKAMEDSFRALPEKIDSIIDFEWGTNVGAEGKDKGFTHC
ncbi:MAG: Dabb family protein, partial [Verrucomicrobiota bacterium]